MQQSAESIPMRKCVQVAQQEFLKRHGAIVILRNEGSSLSHFLAKRLGQDRATAEWLIIHPHCMRLTVTYRGQVWLIRVPKPKPPEEE